MSTNSALQGVEVLGLWPATPPQRSSPLTLSRSSRPCTARTTRAAARNSWPSASRAPGARRRRAPDFLPETAAVRAGAWTRRAAPADLHDRRVEITGPVDRKMVINALNSGAKVFMADFEDANSPTWENLLEGQINLRDAVRRTIDVHQPRGKGYRLNEKTATLLVRPRGWHLAEKHVLVDGKPVSGSLFDFGLYFFHNARELLARGHGPVLLSAEDGEPPRGPPVERRVRPGAGGARHPAGHHPGHGAHRDHPRRLRDRRDPLRAARTLAGLNCGRWDYIFSCIKKFRQRPDFVLPDRAQVTMTTPLHARLLAC